ncbi:HDIG domain-containing protein [Clostridium aestuarii]|uniref:HDIG domain-containing protein n=1 Tax=Clostridium aestuarii TaxID=338193 RepID=A0ABT4D6N1_9CLOT|nr:HDIG domain-containing protein [Clostridium aestuarii]
MLIYRIKQFYWALNSKINVQDKQFLKMYLSEEEINIFSKLAVDEQKHSIRTAKAVENIYLQHNINKKYMLIKAALLHDIGKIDSELNYIYKALIVLLDKCSRRKIKQFMNIKVVDCYYNHGEKGYFILKKHGYDERFLYLVKNHHNNDIIGDKELDILKYCDDHS